ncbi:MAG: methyltransferase domain-containing protein [Candidatus Melainabacteria bacterium]|jgi:hypothetical protein|nr:methyltransferase domain-containing protein [Candidatus Melainabacteria bacterium]
MAIPIKPNTGITLEPSALNGIARVIVDDTSAKMDLSWDRFVRLKRAAEATALTKPTTILDAGGYDGAIAFFLEGVSIDVIDPATTGGSVLEIPSGDRAYDVVVAVDVLEHIEPKDRAKALSEFARVARKHVILNYPCRESKSAQRLALNLTNNSLVREHVEWELPDSEWVLEELAKHGYRGTVSPHTSIAIWLGQYVTLNLVPDAANELNRHLVENYAEEPTTKPLYHLLMCERESFGGLSDGDR